MNQRTRLRLGVVGVGRRGREHLDTIASLGDRYDLVAVCDLSEAAAQAAAAKCPLLE
jgi:predicted dehydrogenase